MAQVPCIGLYKPYTNLPFLGSVSHVFLPSGMTVPKHQASGEKGQKALGLGWLLSMSHPGWLMTGSLCHGLFSKNPVI